MIHCDQLTRRFGDITAVDRVTFDVARQSIFGFLGPNGSGKSTVIRMLCGLLEPTEGRATIAGLDVNRQSDELKGLIGYMSQKFSLYDELTAYENLTFYGRLYGLHGDALARRRDELVALMHLEPYLERRAAMLSGGWRQRLAMACALVHRPQVLFLDEPTAGIDPVARRELWDLLFRFADEGMTLFITTHYMDEAERCSHVGYLHLSKLIVCGEPAALKTLLAVNAAGTRRLEIFCDHVTTGLQAVRRLPGVRSATIFGQTINAVVEDALPNAALLAALQEAGLRDVDLRPVAPSLEDVFVTLTEAFTAEART